MRTYGAYLIIIVAILSVLGAGSALFTGRPLAQSAPGIVVSSAVPRELNPPFDPGGAGGAPMATPDQAARFAWQEFIALNWPAGPQEGIYNQREAPSVRCNFGNTSPSCSLLVWETMRGKVEIFPGQDQPPGYRNSGAANDWGYDALPAYDYISIVPACDPRQASDATPWVNLDETDQITLDNMYAGVVSSHDSPGNTAPQLVRFLAKANRSEYVYVAGNKWWSSIPVSVVNATRNYLNTYKKSPPAGDPNLVSLSNGTIEIKAGWRPLTRPEAASGRFHVQTVRFYEKNGNSRCYRDATWGLVALHIIQKTPSAPYFIYATFEQADNILTPDGRPLEDPNGTIIAHPRPAAATSPQVCLVDPKPPPPPQPGPSTSGTVILTADPNTCQPTRPPPTYCDAPGSRLYYRNQDYGTNGEPAGGNICINERYNTIPDYVISANRLAHAAINNYLHGEPSPWSYYKLINVQYYPYDKIPDTRKSNGSPYTSHPPFSATNPAPSSYYQSNIVVESNRSLQMFSGGLSPNIATDWNNDGTPHKNTLYGGRAYNMGGCMGCHGSQGQNPIGSAGDFSVILANGSVGSPEVPALPTLTGLTHVIRNRSLSR